MTGDKTPWRKPEITVLVRSRPEEAVLAGCRLSGRERSSQRSCGLQDYEQEWRVLDQELRDGHEFVAARREFCRLAVKRPLDYRVG